MRWQHGDASIALDVDLAAGSANVVASGADSSTGAGTPA
jgi:hypothetical protein